MLSLLFLTGFLSLFSSTAFAGYEHNLNYRSPYINHPQLAIDVPALRKRQQGEGLRLSKRQGPPGPGLQIVAPGAGGQQKTSNYLLYGGAVNWSASDFIYSGNVNFSHGVASGDPYDFSVLIWTRAFPLDNATRDVPVCVNYTVTDQANLTGNVVSQGFAYTSYDVDNTVKVEVAGLQAETYYWYQFANCAKPQEKSIVGRTKTAPGYTATGVNTQRFAIYSCSNYPNGFFNAYGGPYFNNDTDYVVHLGDYIYESGSNTTGAKINRTVVPQREIFSLEDYRQRYALYRTDPDLLLSHANFPWIAIWDDHEIADNGWKAGTDNSNDSYAGCLNGGICFSERAANAKRAYHEWIPIREVDVSNEGRIWRDFRFGDLVDVVALDTRNYMRDITDNYYNTEYVTGLATMLNSSRSMTGQVQEQWLLDTLDASHQRQTKWRLVLNQVIFGTVNYAYTSANPNTSTFPIDVDAWDGYQAQRARVLQHAYDNSYVNTIIVSGDSHSNWLYENKLNNVMTGSSDPEANLTAVSVTTAGNDTRGTLIEFAGTAVSSSGYGASFLTEANSTNIAAKGVTAHSPGLLWSEGFLRGYMGVEISPGSLTTSFWAYPDNQIRRTQNRTLSARFVVQSGANAIQRPMNATFGAFKQV